TQQIIAYESGVVDTVDPLGGSFFIESLTGRLEDAAFGYIKAIDSMGGAVKAIEIGFMQDEIAQAAYDFQTDVESGEQIVVGVNKYVDDRVRSANVFRVDDNIRTQQVERLISLKKTRSEVKVQAALSRLRAAASGTKNTMPFILDAVEEYATIGEISDELRAVFGEFKS